MSKEDLRNHALDKYGLTLNEFSDVCKGAADEFDGKGMHSTDHALAWDSYTKGFQLAIRLYCREDTNGTSK